MYDRKTYFDTVRVYPFNGNLTQGQVDGQEAILTQWEAVRSGTDQRWLAYMLATAFHETAATMQPIAEYGKGAGHPYGVPDPVTGETYYGRGLVQLTWKENYQRASDEIGAPLDLVHQPDLALTNQKDTEPSYIASRVMFLGMEQGWFTGKKLSDYFNVSKDDPKNARQIINGNDKDTLIAEYHEGFLTALQAAYVTPPPPAELVDPVVDTKVITIVITVPADAKVEVLCG